MRSKTLFSFTVAASSVALCLAPKPAEAVSVTVNGTTYDVTTFDGTYNANTSKFNTLVNNGLMPWWGSQSLAKQFAKEVGSSLGIPVLGAFGPQFSHSIQDSGFAIYVNGETFYPDSSEVFGIGATTRETTTYAIATLAPPPPPAGVPAPLPLFGAAAAFSMSRRLRRRIQLGG